MENKEFEVGKFYRLHLYPSYGTHGNGVPAMAVRKTKTKIVFKYIHRSVGDVCKLTADRRLVPASEGGCEAARARERWSGIPMTLSTEVCGKPRNWDVVPEAVKAGKNKGDGAAGASPDGGGEAAAAAQKAACEKYLRLKGEAEKHLDGRIKEWLARLGLAEEFNVSSIACDHAITVESEPDSRRNRASFDIRYRPDWFAKPGAEGARRRVLEVAFSDIRLSADRGKDMLAARAAGMFAQHFAEIEADLGKFAWAEYDAAVLEMERLKTN